MKKERVNAEHAVCEYEAGRSMRKIASELRISPKIIRRNLLMAGVQLRNRSDMMKLAVSQRSDTERREAYARGGLVRRIGLPEAQLIERYLAGESEKALAGTFGCSRSVIRTRLLSADGVTIRGRSESSLLHWATMTPAMRRRQVAAAHTATRGRKRSMAEKMRHARTVEARALHRSPAEIDLADMLLARGIVTIPQQAIGPYNCDLGASPVAVEIFGGKWHWSGRHLLRTPRRFRYLMKAGWHILVVHVTPVEFPLTGTTADYIATYAEKMRRDPSARREYRVIRGAGEVLASGCVDDKEISIIPALAHGRDAATGRYKGVPR